VSATVTVGATCHCNGDLHSVLVLFVHSLVHVVFVDGPSCEIDLRQEHRNGSPNITWRAVLTFGSTAVAVSAIVTMFLQLESRDHL
jgi:hypothetical protein